MTQLPICEHASLLIETVKDNAVVVVMAETGSGKTTQIPQVILLLTLTRSVLEAVTSLTYAHLKR